MYNQQFALVGCPVLCVDVQVSIPFHTCNLYQKSGDDVILHICFQQAVNSVYPLHIYYIHTNATQYWRAVSPAIK